jgi:hypothetical protein
MDMKNEVQSRLAKKLKDSYNKANKLRTPYLLSELTELRLDSFSSVAEYLKEHRRLSRLLCEAGEPLSENQLVNNILTHLPTDWDDFVRPLYRHASLMNKTLALDHIETQLKDKETKRQPTNEPVAEKAFLAKKNLRIFEEMENMKRGNQRLAFFDRSLARSKRIKPVGA